MALDAESKSPDGRLTSDKQVSLDGSLLPLIYFLTFTEFEWSQQAVSLCQEPIDPIYRAFQSVTALKEGYLYRIFVEILIEDQLYENKISIPGPEL